MSRGEFGPDVVGTAATVAVVLTQAWCPQWQWMRSYLDSLPDCPDSRIYYLEYDREPFYEEFLEFKEDTLGNREIPYVRYYREGRIAGDGNYIAKDGFLKRLGSAG